ncbi:YkgJ family cysteine cluster protein [Nitrospira sp. Kam-Ns4a]
MAESGSVERFEVCVNTPAGRLTSTVEVPSGFVPVSAIVPVLRRVGEQTLALEERQAVAAGASVSCKKGCAACCRMLVPVSAPEAFALHAMVERLPEARRRALRAKVAEARGRLDAAGLLGRLTAVAETDRQLQDEDLESLNRAYYALRLPCPFLEDEVCSIYEDRPAACRELVVTTPAEWCQDLLHHRVRPLPVAVRVSTALGLLWAELTGGPARLIPLPVALDWAERHEAERSRRWPGSALFEKAMDKVWWLLSKVFTEGSPVP